MEQRDDLSILSRELMTWVRDVGAGDLEESRIAPQKKLALAGRDAPPPTLSAGGVRRELWLWLLAAVIALSVVEWLTYHRRVTV